MAAVGPNYQTVSGKSERGNFRELEIKERFIIHIERRVWFSRRKSEIIHRRTVVQNSTTLPLTRGAFSGGSERENPTASPQPIKGRNILLSECNVRVMFMPGSSQVDGCMIPHMITSGCLRASPQKREWPISTDQEEAARGGLQLKPECWWLISRHVAAPSGASSLLAFLPFSLYTHTLSLSHKHTHTHTRCSPAYLSEEREPPSPTAQSFSAFFPSLYLLAVIYLWDGIRAAPNANML